MMTGKGVEIEKAGWEETVQAGCRFYADEFAFERLVWMGVCERQVI